MTVTEDKPTQLDNTPEARYGYVHGLDGLRLLAVLIVIVRHYELVMILPGGFGVSIFFFISGFLITRLLLAEEHRFQRPIAIKSFYIRRFIRLLPPLLLMGVIAVPALYYFYPEDFSPAQIAMSFTYLGNITKYGAMAWGWREGYPAIEPLWSLAVEEHFYLLLPAALLLFRTPRSRVIMMSVAVVVPLIIRVWYYEVAPVALADQFNYHFTFTRLDSIGFGVLLTLLLDAGWLRIPSRRFVGHLLVFGGGLLMLASMVHWSQAYEIAWKYSFQSLAIGIFFVGVIFAPNYRWLRRLLERKPIAHLGKISYEMYLWHLPILAVLVAVLPNRALAIPIALVATVLISDGAYRLTTKRLSGLRRRFGGHPV
ncbi:acyltransferase family protein [Mycolicibacterium cosmeticum]|uniref:Integral membrane protein n=1 Tax=Mycolicibacterium cosmeticum TaxID=258533 RepID=W9BMH1_MYCCO|nr:acyltransferase [Mycolicibacterium cosmeticum]CDO11390.1 integral membrane protein [Mycolicibacterium cosmeticum]